MRAAEPRRMKLDLLAEHCEDETEHFFHPEPARPPDPRYCFEIFRRALAGRDPLAWEAIYRQYAPLVAGWVARHPEIERSGGEIQLFVNDAFRRMWAAIPPARFRCFRDLAPLLAYLKMCAHSAVIEEARNAGFLRRMADIDALPAETSPAQRGDLDSPLDRLAFAVELREVLWRAVNSRLRDRKERLVVHCLFELDLKPREIFDRHPDTFHDVREIYTIRQVVMERLARDPALQALVAQHA
jgi:DNA-directed RNA polymerase specialized sigma24 family protein